jgi:hypothetical protein
MTVTSSFVCGRAHPYIMSLKPCWRRIASGKVVTGLAGCERIRASRRLRHRADEQGSRSSDGRGQLSPFGSGVGSHATEIYAKFAAANAALDFSALIEPLRSGDRRTFGGQYFR